MHAPTGRCLPALCVIAFSCGTPVGAQVRHGLPDEEPPETHAWQLAPPTRGEASAPTLDLLAGPAVRNLRPSTGPHVVIRDVYTRHAAHRAFAGAADWLEHTPCQGVFAEFMDGAGHPLTDSLKRLEVTGASYLQLLKVYDGDGRGPCKASALAFTAIGSRAVFLCGREFERAWRRDARAAQAVVIHEALHSLGLPENPPSPRYITYRVSARCWR